MTTLLLLMTGAGLMLLLVLLAINWGARKLIRAALGE